MVCSCLAAQEAPANPFVTYQKGVYGYMMNTVIRAADEMPEANYSYQPISSVRTFGQLVGHVADAQYLFCSVASGEKNPGLNIEKTRTKKADLIQALKDAETYCNKAYDGLTDAQAAQAVSMFGRQMPKLMILEVNNMHADEHYGNMVTYLRMKGLVPPSSQQNQ